VINFDAAHAIEFLDQVLGDCPSGRIAVFCAIDLGSNVRHAHFQWAHEAVAQAEAWDKLKPIGVYFRVTMLPPSGPIRRGTADEAHMINFLWADLDFGSVGHKSPKNKNGHPLPATEEAARQLIEGMPEPTIMVHSGGGLYPIWQLAQPVLITDDNRAEIVKLSERWQNMISRRAESLKFHYGNVGDLSRVLRLPGSVNRKDHQERPCRVIEATGQRHELIKTDGGTGYESDGSYRG
jgi:putative DNA primase/helicase